MISVSWHPGVLQPFRGARKRPKRLGCGFGSGHGLQSTRGMKGQRSRSGDGRRPGFEGGQTPLLRRIPKRGFSNLAFKRKWRWVNVGDLERLFRGQKEVSVEILVKKGLARPGQPIKLLGNGELKKPLKIQAHAASPGAISKVTQAGGEVTLIQIP